MAGFRRGIELFYEVEVLAREDFLRFWFFAIFMEVPQLIAANRIQVCVSQIIPARTLPGVTVMRSIKRDLIGLSIYLALILSFALAVGRPFLIGHPAYAQGDSLQQRNHVAPNTFTGTIVKDHGQFVLEEAAGAKYQLDDRGQATTYEGKAVKVTGQLDEQSMVIHVKNIEGAQG